MAEVLGGNPKVSVFEFQSRYYVYFRIYTLGKDMKLLYFKQWGSFINVVLLQGGFWQ